MPKIALTALLSTLLLSGHSSLAQAKPTLDEVFNGDMLGANLRYLESLTGPARTSFGDEHEYRVEGCDIRVTAAEGHISALNMRLSERCHVNLADFISPDYATPAQAGQSLSAYSKQIPDLLFYSYCIYSCGNAADPSVIAKWEGGRAQGNIEIELEMVIADDQSIEATNKWQDLMVKAKGQDYVIDTRFNCQDEYQFNQAARELFAPVRVNSITIGYGLQTPPCH